MIKTILTVLFVGLILACNTKPQRSEADRIADEIKTKRKAAKPYRALWEFDGDTLKYLHENFAQGKGRYIGLPFSELLLDVELPVLTYTTSSLSGPYMGMSNGVSLYFEKNGYAIRKWDTGLVPYVLIVTLSDTLSDERRRAIIMESKLAWTQKTAAHFEKMRVTDVSLTVYSQKKKTTFKKDLKKW